MKRHIYRGLVGAGRLAQLDRLTASDQLGTLRVLMYHKVSIEPGPLAVSLSSFTRQQELLASSYRVVSLDHVLQCVRTRTTLPARAVLLTFDDGYRDNLEVAKPILDRFGHDATIFIHTDFIASGERPSHNGACAQESENLTWDQLRTLAKSFAVGSHGCSHTVMTKLTLPEAERELAESKRRLESELGTPVTALAYPMGSIGDFNRELEDASARTGYELVFTTLPGINRPSFNPRRIRRHNVEDYGLDYFHALLDGSAMLLALKDSRVGYLSKRAVNGFRGRYY